MLKSFMLTFLLIPLLGIGQPLVFEYDSAGNQVKRELSFGSGRPSNIQDTATETTVALKKFFPEDEISYYPNPVDQELFLSWENHENTYVSDISIFNMSGQLLTSYKMDGQSNESKLTFQKYAQGIYNVILSYSDGKIKAIKIVKE